MIADIARYIVATLAMLTAGSTTIVFALYVRAWARAPSGSGIVPRHVALVSLGTMILVVGVGIGVYQSIGNDGFNPRLIGYIIALLLILVAVIDIGNLQRGRIRKTGRHKLRRDRRPPK